MKDVIKRARLIYNPTSGQEIIKKNIAEVLDVLEDVGYDARASFCAKRSRAGS